MYEEIIQNALALLPCRLIWILNIQDQYLSTETVATDIGDTSAKQFLEMIQINSPPEGFPLQSAHNPLSDIVLSKTPAYNLSPDAIARRPGGKSFAPVLIDFGIYTLNLLPLIHEDNPVGLLVLGFRDQQSITDNRTRQIIHLLQHQTTLCIHNQQINQQFNRIKDNLASERKFRRLILETVGDGMVAIDGDIKVLHISRKLLELTGYTPEEIIGQSVALLFSEASRPMLVRSLNATRHMTMSYTQELQSRDGHIIPVLMSRIMTRHLSDFKENSIIIFSDLSDLHQRQQALEQQSGRLQALYRAAQAISSQLSLNEVIEIILASALEVLQGEVASILLRDVDNTDELIFVATFGPYAERMKGRRVPVGMGITGQIAADATPRLITDTTADSDFLPGFDCDPEVQAHTIAAVPLMAGDSVIGVLEIINKQNDSMFDHDDLAILENLASSAALAIERASLFEQTSRRLIEMSTLLDASSAVTSTLELEKILEVIARRLRDALEVQQVVIATRESIQQEELAVHACVVNAHWEPELSSCPHIDLQQTFYKQKTIQERQPTIVSRRSSRLSSLEKIELEVRGMQIVINVPLRFNNKLAGIICIYHTDPNFQFTAALSTAVDDAILSWENNTDIASEELSDLCHRILQATDFPWCSIYLLDQNRENIVLMREIGTGLWRYGDGLHWPLEKYTTIQQVLRQDQALFVWTESLDDDPGERDYLRSIGAGSCLIAPLIIRGEARGLVKLITTDQRIFDESEITLSKGIANVVGNALENASLFTSLEQRATQLEAAYTELEEADRLKDELLQNVSHELSTPLMHALGYLNLMSDEAFGELNGEQRETLNLITRKTQTISDLVKNMVAVHDSRDNELDIKSHRIEQVAALTVRSLSPRASASNISIIPRIPHDLPSAMIDRSRIGQVFEALIDNAIKFSPTGSRIEIGIEENGVMLRVSVHDEGIGIDPSEHEKIFRRFYQVDGGMTRRYGGVGLGLAIVQNVVKSHGGKVWVESTPGKGTTVYFTVPTASIEAPATDQNNVFA